MLRSSGADCPDGIRYRDVTAMFKLPAGTYVARLSSGGLAREERVTLVK